MQSILASLMFFSFRDVAASSYSGARALQCPLRDRSVSSCHGKPGRLVMPHQSATHHHGAKTASHKLESAHVYAFDSSGNLHSARTRSFDLMKSSKVSFFSCVTSEAVAKAAAARTPRANLHAECMALALMDGIWRAAEWVC